MDPAGAGRLRSLRLEGKALDARVKGANARRDIGAEA
jgi:hypothetical protein